MLSRRLIAVFAAGFVLVPLLCLAQEAAKSAPSSAPAAVAGVDPKFVKEQFGSEFTLVPSFVPLKSDFDGDGVEDIAFVAKAKNPMADEEEHGYRVVDPYDSFFGVGDPRITSQFGTEDPEHRGMVLLIIHGAGAQAWRSDKPKAKFVIINIPFKQLAVKHLKVKKKVVNAVYAEESGADEMTSMIFFDGKKYKYQPLGGSMQ